MAAATAAPCSGSPIGLAAIASLSQNLDLALRGSPLVDAALQTMSRVASVGGVEYHNDDDVIECFDKIQRAAETLADVVQHVQGMQGTLAPPCHREHMPDGLDLGAIINMSQGILRTLQYVQQDRIDGGDGYPAPGNEYTTKNELAGQPESPRQSIARGQRRKQEQQHQRSVRHKKQEVRSSKDEETYRPTYCRHCNRTETVKWRQGPDGVRTLCNVCGLLYAKRLQRFRRQ
ncbi:hypothetical protein PG993_010211 [Apiospora rasikravindrae]|uniref:GATA-type domain-containing protein n=1 Tax=Apiospora rasikravindrae TaxID=990691 RepID=A0ABR1SLN0_9PEZI